MVATTRTVFDHQLQDLQNRTLQLAGQVAEQLLQATRALQQHDLNLAQRVDKADAEINAIRFEIEESCYTLLALQQPNSHDMRRIVASVSVVTNLERMGDHAAGIARLALEMDRSIPVEEFDEMAKIATTNLADAMTAFTTEEIVLARAVVLHDEPVDHLHKAVYDRLIRMMTEDTSTVECATKLLWVSHNLERYADRTSNICERTIYLATGELRHPRVDPMP
jgi:phosphate transport system protein